MKTKSILLIPTGIIVAALILSACSSPSASSTTGTTSPGTTTKPSGTTTAGGDGTTTGHAATPISGGIMYTATTGDINSWDPTKTSTIFVGHMPYTASKLIQGDWTKGPQGTGQTNWMIGYLSDISLMTGELASSWEVPDPTTVIYHINKNATFYKNSNAAANSIVNGRKVTAQDVAWNIIYQYNWPGAWQTVTYPPTTPDKVTDKILPGDPRRPLSVTATDASTVTVKLPPNDTIQLLEMGANMYTNPPEIWTQSNGINSWKDIIASGAWIMSDYVSGSQITYSKNPDYWETDPLYPGKNYKWPYADKLVISIITDSSTLLTAIRTAKIDYYVPTFGGLTHDQFTTLSGQAKGLLSKRRIASTPILAMRTDQKPFDDIRVRQALNMAVDKQTWLSQYLKGDGALLGFPYPPEIDYAKYYTPLDQMPADVKQLYTFDATKAKQLLTDAGYPNGFKVAATTTSLSPNPDEVSAIASYLAKVGVTLDIKVLDPSTYNSQNTSNNYDGMWYGGGGGYWAPNEQLTTKPGVSTNKGHINDPYYTQVGTIIARDMITAPDNYFKTMKEEGVKELQTAWGIFMPMPYQYVVWWPWVKNYDGIGWTGWAGAWQWQKSIFIDPNAKKALGY